MTVTSLKAPEVLAAQAEIDAAQAHVDEALTVLRGKKKVLNALEQDYWTNNMSSYDLNDPEQLQEISRYGWSNGFGGRGTTEYIRDWLSAQDPHIKGNAGWTRTDTTPEIVIPMIIVEIPCTIKDDEIDRLVEMLLRLNETFRSIKGDYAFLIPSNGDQHLLEIMSADNAIVSNTSFYAPENLFEGDLRGALVHISKEIPTCDCGRSHPNDEEDDKWLDIPIPDQHH